jgi:hypothetical protein
MKLLRTLAVTAGLLAFAVPASPALADGFTLNLSAPSTPVVGKSIVIRASGTIPADQLQFPYWFSLSAIPPSVTSTCPEDHFEAMQLANSTGGAVIVLTQREPADATGNFSIPIGVTPTAPGSLLLCGYTDDGEAQTLAGASLMFNIQRAGSGRQATIPQDARAGIRSCRALLSRPLSCERSVIRKANRRCRHLRTGRARTSCLRAVRRVADRT